MDPEWERPERTERCRGGYCTNPRGTDGDLNEEDGAADGDEEGFKRYGAGAGGEGSIGPGADECRVMEKLGSRLCSGWAICGWRSMLFGPREWFPSGCAGFLQGRLGSINKICL